MTSNTIATLGALKQQLLKKYDMKNLGKLKTIIGWQITRDLVWGTMKINQSACIKDLIIKKDLIDSNATIIPMKAGLAIDMPDTDNYKKIKLLKYYWLIGKLMYLAYGTRPNIAYAEGQLSKNNADPRKSHLKAAKKVVQYLKERM